MRRRQSPALNATTTAMSRNCVRLRRTTGKPSPIWCATRNWSTREKSLYPTMTNTLRVRAGMRRRLRRADTQPRLRSKSSRRKKRHLRQQQTKHSEDKANLPRQITIHKATVDSRKANVDSAKAQLDTALLNLSYCHIVAPVDGIASQRSAEIGGRISQGQQLIVVVQIDSVWTTANFKETQLRKMHVGQRVTIEVDSLDESFDGEVEYMPAATGDRSSLFPPENATGNYVKIVQRLPVRIRFNPNQRELDKLRPGMSVEPKVHLN